MPAPSGFLSALGASFMGYGKDQSIRDEAAAREATAAERAKKDAATEQAAQQQRYLQGFRQGTAPTLGGMTDAAPILTAFGGGTGGPVPVDTSRYQQVDPTSYIDTTATPEAIQQRRADDSDAKKRLNEARAHRDRVQAMVGTRLADGTVVTPQLAEAMIASPQIAASFTKTPAAEKPDAVQLVPNGTDAHGNPVFAEYNKTTHQITPIASDITPKLGVGGHAGGVAQSREALMMSAVTEARLADARMRAYEESLLDGSAHINPLQQAAGTLSANLSGTHGVLGSLMQAGSEGALNMTDKRYMQYLRDAQTIGRAESMVMPRGGNEAMVRSNSVLARAGSGAGPETIEAARMARQALFGAAGGIAQTMTPQQTQKLEAGVARIRAGDHGGTPAPTGAKPSLHDRVQQLRAAGVPRAQAMQQLQQEGYDLHGGD